MLEICFITQSGEYSGDPVLEGEKGGELLAGMEMQNSSI